MLTKIPSVIMAAATHLCLLIGDHVFNERRGTSPRKTASLVLKFVTSAVETNFSIVIAAMLALWPLAPRPWMPSSFPGDSVPPSRSTTRKPSFYDVQSASALSSPTTSESDPNGPESGCFSAWKKKAALAGNGRYWLRDKANGSGAHGSGGGGGGGGDCPSRVDLRSNRSSLYLFRPRDPGASRQVEIRGRAARDSEENFMMTTADGIFLRTDVIVTRDGSSEPSPRSTWRGFWHFARARSSPRATPSPVPTLLSRTPTPSPIPGLVLETEEEERTETRTR